VGPLETCLDYGLVVEHAICECDRLERMEDERGLLNKGAEEAVRRVSKGRTRLHSFTNARVILPMAYRDQRPGEEIAKRIEQEYRRHGLIEIKLI
jgi:hypothetical protein